MVKVVLVTTEYCPFCPYARQVWMELKKEHDFEYEEVDATSERGMELVEKFSIDTVPTTIVDDKVAFIGIPDKNKAREMVEGG